MALTVYRRSIIIMKAGKRPNRKRNLLISQAQKCCRYLWKRRQGETKSEKKETRSGKWRVQEEQGRKRDEKEVRERKKKTIKASHDGGKENYIDVLLSLRFYLLGGNRKIV